MHGLMRCGRISAIVFSFIAALPVVVPAQNSVMPTQSLAANSAPASLPSDLRSGVPVNRPASPLSTEQQGDLLEIHKRYQAAIEVYSSIQPRSATVWNKIGIAYQMLDDAKDAARCYRKSLKLESANAHAINNLATVEDTLQQYAAAERNYRKALSLEPGSASILKNLGTNLLMQHEYGRGSEAYAQALTIDPHIFDTFDGPVITPPTPPMERGAANYFKARSCARAGLANCALTHLREAFDEGFATTAKVAKEDDFAGLLGDREFEKLLAEQK